MNNVYRILIVKMINYGRTLARVRETMLLACLLFGEANFTPLFQLLRIWNILE